LSVPVCIDANVDYSRLSSCYTVIIKLSQSKKCNTCVRIQYDAVMRSSARGITVAPGFTAKRTTV
jgi:hypothetical protein